MRQLGATLADGVLLGSVTPELARAAAEEIRTQAKAASRPVPGVYVNVMAGVGAGQLAELDGSAAFLAKLPAYAAHFRRTGIGPEQTWIAASQLSELPPAARTVAGHRRRGRARSGQRRGARPGPRPGGRRHRSVLAATACSPAA
jgi:alkanesulfonate monooxygenase SsuD/methylene tetrahydromethanopterin reductase-like flavin-dependent oxidoreductase (luciferase family)